MANGFFGAIKELFVPYSLDETTGEPIVDGLPVGGIGTPKPDMSAGGKKDNIIKIHTTTEVDISMERPAGIDEIPGIIDSLRAGRTIIVNLESVESRVQRRILDQIAGATYALNANFNRAANGTYVITPQSVNVSGNLMEDVNRAGYGGLF